MERGFEQYRGRRLLPSNQEDRAIGWGPILPKELLARLKLKEGDRLYIVEQTERGIKLSPYDPKHAEGMEIARRSFRKYADAYRALAKSEPRWLDVGLVLDFHAEQLALFGGPDGVRDLGLLESCVARPINKFAYGETDLLVLAAAYGFGIARIHPFVDGNKRAALASMIVFLGLNHLDLDAPKRRLPQLFSASPPERSRRRRWRAGLLAMPSRWLRLGSCPDAIIFLVDKTVIMADREKNRLSARAARYARVGANVGGVAARYAGRRLLGGEPDRAGDASALLPRWGGSRAR